jgi:hypothetical protein
MKKSSLVSNLISHSPQPRKEEEEGKKRGGWWVGIKQNKREKKVPSFTCCIVSYKIPY